MTGCKYKLHGGSRVREEDFGLLFYRINGPRLYFISSGDMIAPDFFEGKMTLKEWVGDNKNTVSEAVISELGKALDQLCGKGVLIEC